MRPLLIFITLILCGLTFWTEFKTIKEDALFTNWFDSVPFWGLCAITFYFLFMSIREYLSHKKIIYLLPLLLCVTVLSITIWHQKKIENLDNSQTKFTASTFDIGSDGGFILDFKVNGHLKAEKRDHWVVTYYWGNYTQKGNKISLNIPLDFKFSKQALLTKDSLHFLGDTTKFIVVKQ